LHLPGERPAHLLGEENVAGAAAALGLVHGGIGIRQERAGVGGSVAGDRDADAGGQGHLPVVDAVWLRELLADVGGQRRRAGAVGGAPRFSRLIATARRASKSTRLGSPVSGSWEAWWASLSWAALRSVMSWICETR